MSPGNDKHQDDAYTIVIIGNGITGITAARTVRKLLPEIKIKIISAESDYFFSRTALMYILMGHLRPIDTEPYERSFYSKNKFELIRSRVSTVEPDKKNVKLESGEKIKYDLLLLATGSISNKFGWPGQDLRGVQGLYSLQDTELLEKRIKEKPKRVVIVGGGLIGIELAEILHSHHIPFSLLVREPSYMSHIFPQEESFLINHEIKKHNIDVRFLTELKSIKNDGNGNVASITTGDNDTIECDIVGLTAGVSPNMSAVENCSSITTARGILIDDFFQTAEKDIFAAGECAQFQLPDGALGKLEQLWYTGRLQGEAVGKVIAKRAAKILSKSSVETSIEAKPYNRGIWFNSAKFFTLEYQTYGFVPNQVDSETSFYWEHPDRSKAIRIVWEKNGHDTRVTGFNLMGIRYRHHVCHDWIESERSIEFVIDHLPEANFDPEFFITNEEKIKIAYKKNNQ